MLRHLLLVLTFFMVPFAIEAFDLSSFFSFSNFREKRHVEDTVEGKENKSVDAMHCIKEFHKKVTKLGIRDRQLASIANFKTFFEESTFSQFCYYYRVATDCIDNANITDPTRVDMFIAGTKGIQFLCIDHFDELTAHLPCYSRSSGQVGSICDSSCGMDVLAAKVEEEERRPRLKPSDAVAMIDNVCDAVSCDLDCEDNITSILCPDDPTAIPFKRLFVAQSFMAMKQLLISLSNVTDSDLNTIVSQWPADCDLLSVGQSTDFTLSPIGSTFPTKFPYGSKEKETKGRSGPFDSSEVLFARKDRVVPYAIPPM